MLSGNPLPQQHYFIYYTDKSDRGTKRTILDFFFHCWSSKKGEAFVGVERRVVRLLHQQNELGKTLSLNLNMPTIITEYSQFFTATILEWKRLLKPILY
jgi:hypothetical protein